jgi:integrase
MKSVAYLELDGESGVYRVRFRYGGRPYKRSIKTVDAIEAAGVVSRVAETIRLLERGRLQMPSDADPAVFIISDGKHAKKASANRGQTLDELLTTYQQSIPAGAKAETTLKTEELHIAHLRKGLSKSKPAQSVTTADMQRYIEKRLHDTYRGRLIRPETVRKEVATFRAIWNWAAMLGHVVGPSPTKGLKYPKTEQKPPFMTFGDIAKIVQRGGFDGEEEARLWERLFLTSSEVSEVLEHVRKNADHDFILPMFVFVAHTGARRSEILRAQIDDFDFKSKTVLIREKKRSHAKSLGFRRVHMSNLLIKTMQEWFARHPGGQHAICEPIKILRGKTREIGVPVTRTEAHDHFKRTLADSKWSKIRGFHVFRHSFASNLAAAGVDQRIIDEWLGHQTEEMRHRYRHLLPDQQQSAIDLVFGGNGE